MAEAVPAEPAGVPPAATPPPGNETDHPGTAADTSAQPVVPPAPVPTAASAEATASPAQPSTSGEVEFLAVKASWILFTVDGQREEREYVKPGKPLRVPFTQRLTVRLGSPSEVTYRFGGREETVVVGKKESRILEFP